MDKLCLMGTNLEESLCHKVFKAFARQTKVEIEYYPFILKTNARYPLLNLYLGGVLAFDGHKGVNVESPFMDKAFNALGGIGRCGVPEAVNNVNVLRRVYGDNIYWEATNTIGVGFYNTIKDNYNFRTALIIGTGSVAKNIAYTLKRHNIEVSLLCLNPEKLGKNKIANKLGVSLAKGLKPYDIIINCTPKTVKDFTFLYDYVAYIEDSYLYDVNYDLVDTNFIKFAKSLHRQCGNFYQDGLAMLIEQSALKWSYWGYDKPDIVTVYQELNALRY